MNTIQTEIDEIMHTAYAKTKALRAAKPTFAILERMNISRDAIGFTVYGDNTIYITVNEDLDIVMDYLMPALKWGCDIGPNWDRNVEETTVSHRVDFKVPYKGQDYEININIVSQEAQDGSCRIVKVATGEKTMKTRWIDEEVEKFTYAVKCD